MIPIPMINIPMENIDKRANFLLGYYTNDDNIESQLRWQARGFYASKVYMSIEEEDIRGEKKLLTGETRVRYKKRRKIDLQVPFFDDFNKVTYYDDRYCEQINNICTQWPLPVGDFCVYSRSTFKCKGIIVPNPNNNLNFGSYKEFETILNAPALAFQPLGKILNNYYNGIDVPESNITRWIRVNFKDKKTEYLNDHLSR